MLGLVVCCFQFVGVVCIYGYIQDVSFNCADFLSIFMGKF